MASVEAMGSLAPLLEALRASSAWLRAAKVHGAVIGGSPRSPTTREPRA